MSAQSENSVDYPYHVLDSTTPWYEFLMYCEICHQLNVPDQPNMTKYLKEVNILRNITTT